MSTLEKQLQEYLQLRRSLGHDLADAARLLPRFVAYLDSIGARSITIDAALAWATEPTESNRVTTCAPRRMTAVRGFSRYLAGLDPDTQIPPMGVVPYRHRWRQPYIYSPADIDALLEQTSRTLTLRLRVITYQTLIGLLAATGLRIGEAITLDRADIDWSEGVLRIRESKFGKSRLVPVHASSLSALKNYASQRDLLQPTSLDPSFFVSRTRKRLCYQVVSHTFRHLADTAGVGANAPSPPRLHDLRHTFAINVLLGWYRNGDDVQAKMPSLSTYLGHREPVSTYWYLSAAPELLALAAARMQSAQPGGRS